jgi:spermidine synthase
LSDSLPGNGGAHAWPHVHTESVGPGRLLSLRMDSDWLFEGEESFPSLGGMKQRMQVGEFTEFGKGLVLDGQVQLAEAIDSLYTTALVFPAALTAKSRANWLIVGGGDGAAAREALRFRDTESVALIDISPMVIAQTQALIPSFWAGSQHDPRLRIECRDAWLVLRERVARGEGADVVLFDLTDPHNDAYTPCSESSADHLYTKAAFDLAACILRPGGVFAAQVQELSVLRWQDHARLRRLLRKSFRHVWSYRVYIEFFGYWESFLIASNDAEAPSPVPETEIETKLDRLCIGEARMLWSTDWHRHLFAIPPALQREIAPDCRLT